MITTVVLQIIALVGLLALPEQPKDPASLGYVPLPATPEIHERAFSDLPPIPGSPDEKWLSTQQARIDKAYGPIETYTTDVSTDGIATSLRRAIRALQQSPIFGTPNGQRFRASLESELKRTEGELESSVGKTVPPEFGARLDPTRVISGQITSDIVFFIGTDQQVMFRAEFTQGGSGQSAYYATSEQALEFREVAGRVFAIAALTRGFILKDLGIRLGELNKAWDNYLVNGFSQYPWESYVNGYVTPGLFGHPSWYDPPKDQLVFLHPELGVLADVRNSSSADAQAALFIDAIGYVHYFGDDRGWFLGVSAAASLSNDDVGLGLGPMFHFGNSARGSQLPNVSLGLLWHEPQDGRDGFLIGISVDLWRLFDKSGPEGVLRSAIPGLAP